MPVVYKAASGGIPASYALVIPPDWSDPVRLTYSIASEQVEGHGHRVPCAGSSLHASPGKRHTVRPWTRPRQPPCVKRWPPWAPARGSPCPLAGRLRLQLDARWAVRFPTPPAGAVAYESGSTGPFTHANNGPLLFGRLTERPTITPIGGRSGSCRSRCRKIRPTHCASTPSAARRPQPSSGCRTGRTDLGSLRDQLRPVSIGRGRETAMSGTNGTPAGASRRASRSTAPRAARLLRFWVAARRLRLVRCRCLGPPRHVDHQPRPKRTRPLRCGSAHAFLHDHHASRPRSSCGRSWTRARNPGDGRRCWPRSLGRAAPRPG